LSILYMLMSTSFWINVIKMMTFLMGIYFLAFYIVIGIYGSASFCILLLLKNICSVILHSVICLARFICRRLSVSYIT
jgi:hypothetical protein